MRSSIRSAFRNTLRPVWGDGTSETPLQADAIAAWDMQEASGALLPAKGNITIGAQGTPGSATFTGDILARDVTGVLDYFEVASDPVFQLPATGTKTIRIWAVSKTSSTSQGALLGKSINPSANSSGDEYVITHNDGNRIRTFLRAGDDSGRNNYIDGGAGITQDKLFRYEIELNTAGSSVHRTYNFTDDIRSSAVIAQTSFLQNNNPFSIGRVSSSSFDGHITLLCIWNRALTPEEREADEVPTRFASLGK